MTVWELPTSLEIGGVGFSIRTDFRAVLDILQAYSDPDLEEQDKVMICLAILYKDFEKINPDDYPEAIQKAIEFIDLGETTKDDSPRLMDWNHDAKMIIPEVNKVLGYEVRMPKETHWWTFMGAYMGIGEGLFSNVLSIRQKKAKGKKLEQYEKDFETANKDLIRLPEHLKEEDKLRADAEKERLEKLLKGEI